MKFPRAVALAALCVSPASAQEEITFKGVPLGSPPPKFLEVVPGAQCVGDNCFLWVMNACRNAQGSGGSAYADCLKQYTYGGRVPISIVATFQGDALASVLVRISERSFSDLLVSLQERFGAPDRDEPSTIQNRAGATFDNRRVSWIRGDTVLMITKRMGKIDEGAVYITSRLYAEKSAREREQKAKAGAKDL